MSRFPTGPAPHEGALETYPLPRLLHLLLLERVTGVLRLALPAGPAEVYLRDGQVAAVEIPGDFDRLGQVLVASGLLDEERRRRSLTAPRPPGLRYGRMLVEGGLLAEAQLLAALRLQVRRRLHRLFFADGGRFSIDEGDHLRGAEGRDAVRVHPYRAIWQGVKSAWSEARFGGALSGGTLQLAATAEMLAAYGFAEAELAIVRLLGERSRPLVELSASSESPTLPRAIVYTLLVTDALVDTAASFTPAPPAVTAPPPAVTAPPPAVSHPRAPVHSPPFAYSPTVAQTPLNAPAQSSRSFGQTLPPELLHVTGPTATAAVSPVHRFDDPDAVEHRPSQAPPRSAPPTPAPVSAPRPTDDRLPAMSPARPLRPLGTAPVSIDVPVSPDALARVIAQKVASVDGEDYFQVLGVGRDTGKAELKTAYLSAAKMFHPDRLGAAGLASLRPDAERIFRRVSEAYATLSDEQRRGVYVARLEKPAGESAAEVDAQRVVAGEMAFMEGEVAWKRRDYAQAIERFAQAAELNPAEGEAVALLAWVRLAAGKIAATEARAELERAIGLSPRCARAHYFLGVVQKQAGDAARAIESFKRATSLDPHLAEAQSELRVLLHRSTKDSGVGHAGSAGAGSSPHARSDTRRSLFDILKKK